MSTHATPHHTTPHPSLPPKQGEPKAIPWSHTTPLRCAVDGWSLQDIQPGQVVCWPTNLGWMMGPWLVYASLLNGATMALYQVCVCVRLLCTRERPAVWVLGGVRLCEAV